MLEIKQYSAACERNQEPILEVLSQIFSTGGTILEIGAGSGQHALYFAQHLPECTWQPSDLEVNLPSIQAWADEAQGVPPLPPIKLDVSDRASWPEATFAGVFTANTTHIMSVEAVAEMFACVGACLAAGGAFCQYGPFKYNCAFTSPSNSDFDGWLKDRDPASGIRDVEWLQLLASEQAMTLEADHAMPANNQLLVWRRGI